MDYLEHLLILSIDGLVICFCYSHYQRIKTLCSNFAKAQESINPTSRKNRENNTNFVIVQGSVKACKYPIKSLNSSSCKGVIQKLTIKEHAITRSGHGFWNDRERIIDERYNTVPFELQNGSYRVKIEAPLEAEYLSLDVVQDRFEPSFSNFMGKVVGYFVGIHQQGFQYTEYLLKEDTFITGYGELVINKNGELQLQPPSDGSSYVLTTLEPSIFIRKLRASNRIYKLSLVICTSVGIFIIGFMLRKWWTNRREEMKKMQVINVKTKARINRQNNSSSQGPESLNCVICFENPREIILLPCGHVSICSDCVENVRQNCPICREKINSVNLAFIS